MQSRPTSRLLTCNFPRRPQPIQAAKADFLNGFYKCTNQLVCASQST